MPYTPPQFPPSPRKPLPAYAPAASYAPTEDPPETAVFPTAAPVSAKRKISKPPLPDPAGIRQRTNGVPRLMPRLDMQKFAVDPNYVAKHLQIT